MFNQNTKLKIFSLGGAGEVTRNMYVYEYGNDQLIVDCGMGFPTAQMPGVDLLIPDISYLEASKKKIHAIVLTHGHEDHIGGLPYVLPRLPKNLPVYGSKLTSALAEVKVREFGLTNPFTVVDNKPLTFGPFRIDFIHVTHSIPNCKHLVIKTPAGTVYHGADFKFDLTPPDGNPPDLNAIARAGDAGIDLLISDCLRVEKEGFTLPERKIEETFENELRKTKGKFIVTSMSSSISRFGMAINVAARAGRKVALVGRSVDKNMTLAANLGFVTLPKNTLIKPEQIRHFKDSQVCIIIAGSQGQEGSAMHRASTGEHRFVHLKAGDRVVISSDPIPGNEGPVGSLIETLIKKGIDVSTSETVSSDLHVSGHGYRGELELLIRLAKPKFFYPVGGTFRHQFHYQKMVGDLGYPQDRVFIPQDGQSVVLDKHHATYGESIDVKNIYVDGLGIGDVGKLVLRDRLAMASDGIVIVVTPIRHDTGKISGQIEVVSRGFVYVKENSELMNNIKKEVEKAISFQHGAVTDWGQLRKRIEDHLEKFLFNKTERHPLILPVIVEV